MLRASLLVLALSGCYHPNVPEGAPCALTTDCPPPQTCDVGRCRLTTLPDGAVPGDTAADSRETDASLIDAPPPMCSHPVSLGAFAAPTVILPVASTAFDGTPSLSSDLLEMYFKSNRTGNQADIFLTTRTSSQAAWSSPTTVTELSSVFEEGSPDLSPDRLTMYISSNRGGGAGGFDVWKSTRTTVSSPWSAPVNVSELNTLALDEGFTVVGARLVGYLHSDRDGAIRLYRTTRTGPGAPWSTPVLIPEIATTATSENAAVTADDCAMYFQSNRSGGLGSDDLWFMSRTTPTGTWDAAVNLTTVNSTVYEADPWISADQRYLVFATQLTGSLDLHEARR